MTTLEISDNLTAEERAGFEFAGAREVLGHMFTKPSVHNVEYETAVAAYLNAAQAYLFETDLERRCSVVSNAGMVIKNEVQLVCGYSIDCAQDVQARFEAYCQDETAQAYRQQLISPMPRAFTLLLMDFLLDEVRPNTYE